MSAKLPRLKFYLDENFPVPAGKFLKSMRQNVVFAVYLKQAKQKSDIWQLKYAIKTNRILVALDKDFSYQRQLIGLTKSSEGVILIKSSNPNLKKLNQILDKLLKNISQTKISGKICVASIDKIEYFDPNKL